MWTTNISTNHSITSEKLAGLVKKVENVPTTKMSVIITADN